MIQRCGVDWRAAYPLGHAHFGDIEKHREKEMENCAEKPKGAKKRNFK